ncbi:helix-turn-helix transcriptional regulator [Catenulispora subtropica]|uniref:HTH luxR-type domain-containing protein n=1 Tax=Catenulispora subtropica TaxID=450798 RepID=A0ABP5DL54_9ACTN
MSITAPTATAPEQPTARPLPHAGENPAPCLPESGTASPTEGSSPLDPVTVAVYQWALEHGRMPRHGGPALTAALGIGPDEARHAVDRLLDLRLVCAAVDTVEELVPTSPETAAAELSGPMEVRIQELEHRIGEVKAQVLSVKDVYFASRRKRNRREAVDVVQAGEPLRSVLAGCRRRSSAEILGVFPGQLEGDRVLELAVLGFEPLKRGVRVRLLFQHPARVQRGARDLLDRLSEAGCEVRTCDVASDRILLFDRETVFLPDRADPSATVVIREPTTVDFIHRATEQLWSTAVPYEAGATNSLEYGEAEEVLKKSIALLLATGAKDEFIARRLSISVRTCRRHIAEIMTDLKASSRFQAGVNALRAGLIPPGPVEVEAASL